MIYLSRFRSFSATSSHRQIPVSQDALQPLRQWLNRVEVRHPAQAHLICQRIPAQCPSERAVRFGSRLLPQAAPG